MIKNYKQYIKESLLDKIEGPSEKEFMDTFYTSTPYQFISNATKNGYLKGVEFALKMGIQVFDKPELLTSAVNSNNVDVVKLLIKNEVGKRFLYNGMVRATANNNLEILKLLYKYGPEYLFKTSIVYHSENFDMNLIDSAVTQNSIDCLKFLLRVGVSCNIRKVDKKYPLYLAIISYTTNKDYLEIIKLLLEYGSVVDDTIMECAEKFADDVVYNLIKNKYNEKQGLKESLLDKIEGPSKEKIWKNLGYEKGFDTPEEFFLDVIKDIKIKPQTKYPNSVYWGKNGEIVFEQDLKNMFLWVSYDTIWKIFERIFDMNYGETRTFIKGRVEEYLNWKGFTTGILRFKLPN